MKDYKKCSKFESRILEHAEAFCFLIMLFSSLFIILLFTNMLSMYLMDLNGLIHYSASDYILKGSLFCVNIISFFLSRSFLFKLI